MYWIYNGNAEMGYLVLEGLFVLKYIFEYLYLYLDVMYLFPLKNCWTAKLHNKLVKPHIHVTYSYHIFAHMVYLASNDASSTLECIVTSDETGY